MKQLGELQESRNELLSRVSNLKRDLQDWRFKLDNQVKTYRTVRSTRLSSMALGGRSSDNFSLPTPLLHARANTHTFHHLFRNLAI